MQQYKDLLQNILDNGVDKTDRTGIGTKSIFGYQMRFDLSKGFPLVTIKKTNFNSIMHELLWFIAGNTNTEYLVAHGVHIWDEWAKPDGSLGKIYGYQWRNFGARFNPGPFGPITLPGVDQLKNVVERIKTHPDCRRLIVSAWNPVDLPEMALPPCHVFFQFYVANGKLSCHLYQRSADSFLGVPFNIASYALLTQMVAQVTNLQLGEFIHTFGDAHIYLNHLDQVKLALTREPMPLSKVVLNPEVKDLFSFTSSDITLTDYVSHPGIKATVAV